MVIEQSRPAPTADSEVKQETPCLQCRLTIPAGATLCHHCKSHQDWRRYLSLSTTVLALLVALLSVASMALPTLIDLTRRPRSALALSNPIIRGSDVYVVVSNLGDRPAVLEKAYLTGPIEGIPEAEIQHPAQSFIPPGSRQVGYRLKFQMNSLDGLKSGVSLLGAGHEAAKLVVWGRESDGEERRFEFPLPGTDVAQAILNHARGCQIDGDKQRRECQSLEDRHKEVQSKLRDVGAAPAPK